MLQLVNMFGFVLDCPLIQHHLRPHLVRLVKLVLMDLDQTELLFYRQRKEAETFGRVSPTAAARLSWTQQLHLQAQGMSCSGVLTQVSPGWSSRGLRSSWTFCRTSKTL